MADLILHHGKVETLDEQSPHAAAIAVRGNRFLAVGDEGQILELAGPETRRIDLEGRLVLPGFCDAHFHFVSWALGLERLPMAGVRSLAELYRKVGERASEVPSGEWILGQGWNESHWEVPVTPTRSELDEVAPRHPVLLWRSDMHMAVANSLALRVAGLEGSVGDLGPELVRIDGAGRPTGVLCERAIERVEDRIPAPGGATVKRAIEKGIALLPRLGLTGIHDFSAWAGEGESRAYHVFSQLDDEGILPLRVWASLPARSLNEAIGLGLRTGLGSDMLRVGHVKLFVDGSQGARTAWMLEPYDDTGECGMTVMSMDEIAGIARSAGEYGLAVAVHAIGDRANQELLTMFARLREERGGTGHAVLAAPQRVEHAQLVRPADIQRLASLELVASVQPVHIVDDMAMVDRSVGERGRFAYPLRDLHQAGVVLALGSDCPVADPNPMWGLHAAVTRQRRDGTPEGGWYPGQRLPLGVALSAFTKGAARASGRESELGTISAGKLADLVVIDEDLMAADPWNIHAARVVLTMCNGKIVYQA